MFVYLCNISSIFSYQPHRTTTMLRKKRLVSWKLLAACSTSLPLPPSGSPPFPASAPVITSLVGSSWPGSSNISSCCSIVSSCFLLIRPYQRTTLERNVTGYLNERTKQNICHLMKCLSMQSLCTEIKCWPNDNWINWTVICKGYILFFCLSTMGMQLQNAGTWHFYWCCRLW